MTHDPPPPGRALIPTRMYLTTGVGRHRHEPQAHDLMYLNAGLGRVSRVRVAGRVPPDCALLTREEGTRLLQDGQILFTVQALAETSTPGRRIGASVAVALPDGRAPGRVAEVHEADAVGKDAAQAAAEAARTALTAVALELGDLGFHADRQYRPERERYVISGKTVTVHAAAVDAVGPENGDHIKIVASLVFLF
ncbi:pyruvoyl-dependent arginine decarboxylase [Streptomyces flavofungini]|uniref:pyruvoyl-dependent arginine decarboxylase n=1 Tax=Streptomyces flavofungini TaxID=68200 RepID=UPI0034DE4F70